MTPAEIAAVAKLLKDSGLPDPCNRFLGMTPEAWLAHEQRLAKPHRIPEDKMKIGKKESALRAAREDSTATPPAGKPATPGAKAPQATETAMNTATPTASPTSTNGTQQPAKAAAAPPAATPAKAPGKPAQAASKPAAAKAPPKGKATPGKPAKAPEKAPAAKPAPAKPAAAKPAAPAKAAAPAAKEDGHKGAFNPSVVKLLVPMVKKGCTVGEIIKAARWGSAGNPTRRVARFLSTVIKGDLKLKVKVDGDGEEAKVSIA